MVMKKWLQFRTTVRNGYNTVRLDKMYVNLRILTYVAKCDVPCLVVVTYLRVWVHDLQDFPYSQQMVTCEATSPFIIIVYFCEIDPFDLK